MCPVLPKCQLNGKADMPCVLKTCKTWHSNVKSDMLLVVWWVLSFCLLRLHHKFHTMKLRHPRCDSDSWTTSQAKIQRGRSAPRFHTIHCWPQKQKHKHKPLQDNRHLGKEKKCILLQKGKAVRQKGLNVSNWMLGISQSLSKLHSLVTNMQRIIYTMVIFCASFWCLSYSVVVHAQERLKLLPTGCLRFWGVSWGVFLAHNSNPKETEKFRRSLKLTFHTVCTKCPGSLFWGSKTGCPSHLLEFSSQIMSHDCWPVPSTKSVNKGWN